MQTIYSFIGQNNPMRPWPSLAPLGKVLPLSGGNLFFYDSGGADNLVKKPALILVHGLGDEADTWRHILPLLAQSGHRVIAPDLPGFGRSQWRGRINLQTHQDAITRLITETGAAAEAENPAVLIGSSMGSGIAEAVAFKRPGLVKALVLLDGCFPFSGNLGKGFFLLGLPLIGKSWYRGFRSNHEAAWKSLYAYYSDLEAMSGEDRSFLKNRVIARVESANQERGYFGSLRSLNMLSLFGKFVFSRRVRAFPGTALLLWGQHDKVFPVERSAAFRRLRPDAVFTTIAGAGHLPHQEKPRETAEAILHFLNHE
jgi:pimeloyl-ACP methyl ester carboxylesterase